ncbi:Flp family type IVb pilin [uncultured Cohaesibacter sp.]|uniref:Flp family type IVb pilin n=1 Tax=uncultured Cohaesibacter sp. TaxID=1002546 RepID=UPI002A0A4AF7|nr:Flp family type IVb pilin [uncultured Cohaesibacter sp.]
MLHKFQVFLEDSSGSTAIEYGVIASLVTAALVLGAGPVGAQLDRILSACVDYIGAIAP